MDDRILHDLGWDARRAPRGTKVPVDADLLIELVDWAASCVPSDDLGWRLTEEWHRGYGDAMDDLHHGDLDITMFGVAELEALIATATERLRVIRPRPVVDVDTQGRT